MDRAQKAESIESLKSVFADAGARRDLEAILHPLIRARAAELETAVPTDRVGVVVIPLLVETGQAGDFDEVLVVDVPEQTQLERLGARDGLDPRAVRARIAAQATRAERLAVATHVLDNAGDLAALAAQVEKLMKEVPGNQDVYTVQNDGVQYLRVIVDRLAAGRYGLSVEDVQDALRVQIEGQRAGTVIDGNRRIPVVVRGQDIVKVSPAEFAAVRITTSNGQSVALGQLAQLERQGGPVKIDREMGSRYSVVIANVTGRDLVGFVEEAKAEGERLAADLRERMNLDPETHPDDLFRHVYATLTPQLREQQAMLDAELDADAESDSQAAHDPSTEAVR